MKRIVALACLVAGCHASEENLGFSAVGTPRWAVTFGGPNDDEGRAAAVDSLGDVVVGGTLDAMAAPGETNAWLARGFITKRVASDGAERWTRTFTSMGVRSASWITDVAVGAQDTVIAVGAYTGTVDFGGQMLSDPDNSGGGFVAAYSSQGQLLWLNGFENTQPLTVVTDRQGQIYAAGVFVSTSLDLGGTIYTESAGDQDSFVAAYDPQGALVWGTAFQATGGPVATGLAIAGNGDLLVTGGLAAPASLGGAVLDPQADSAVFLTRFRRDGLYLASQRLGRMGAYAAVSASIAVDASGHIVIQRVEQDNSQARQPRPNIVQVLADDGHELWSSTIDDRGSYGPQIRTLATTPDGLIVTSSWTDNPVVPDEGSMEVVTYDAAGQSGMDAFGERVAHFVGQTLSYDTAVGAAGSLAYTGAFGGQVDFGAGGPAGTHGEYDTDVFIVAVDPPPAL